MGRPRKYNMELVLAAIKGTGGMMNTIAKRLGTDWDTAKKYCLEWETTKQAIANEEEVTLDLAESILLESIQAGDVQSAKWFLSKKGKRRGYGDEVNLTGDLTYTVIPAKPPEEDGADG